MKKKIIYFSIFILVLALQMSFFPVFTQNLKIADTVLMLILSWSIIDGFSSFLIWAIVFGLFYDIVSYSQVGIHVIIFLATIYFVNYLSKRFSVDFKGVGILLFLIFVIILSLVSHLIIFLGASLEAGNYNGYLQSFGTSSSIFIQLLFNIVSFLSWFYLIKKIKEFFSLNA